MNSRNAQWQSIFENAAKNNNVRLVGWDLGLGSNGKFEHGEVTLSRELTAGEKMTFFDVFQTWLPEDFTSQRQGKTIFFWDDSKFSARFDCRPGYVARAVFTRI